MVNRLQFAVSLILVALALTACGPGDPIPATPGTPAPATATAAPTADDNALPTLSVLERHFVPAYYSPFYVQTIEASKSEDGLLIYSSVDSRNWLPAIRAFREHYPWIEVIVLQGEAGEVFRRYADESRNQQPTADMLASSDLIAWQQFIEDGEVLVYRSPEDAYLPSWARTGFGIYALSSDPLLLIYNKSLLSSAAPESMQQLVAMTGAFQDYYRARIITHDAAASRNSLAINWFWLNRLGEPGWNILNALGDVAPLLSISDQQMVRAVGEGEARLGYFVSSAAVFPALGGYPDLGWTYLGDGQPIQVTSVAITRANTSPNSSKLMMDFLLSQEGQLALALGGLTPYRTDIAKISPLHIEQVAYEVGLENLIFFTLDPGLGDRPTLDAFLARWQSALLRPVSTETPTAAPEGSLETTPTPGN